MQWIFYDRTDRNACLKIQIQIDSYFIEKMLVTTESNSSQYEYLHYKSVTKRHIDVCSLIVKGLYWCQNIICLNTEKNYSLGK
jgi:hypothetical protein